MNIFVLDTNPRLCAQFHCDKHVVKMIVETAQLLCNAHTHFGEDAPYKSTHQNHPCSIWVRECAENYDWLLELGINLCFEYTWRYANRHKTQKVILWCDRNRPELKINGSMTPFAAAMPEKYKVATSIVQAYRSYYIGEKLHFAKWTNRDKPFWIENNQVTN